jgi:hypothetical protein
MEKTAETTKARRSVSSSISAAEKCRAVLSVWTEKRKPGAVCRELGVKWTILMHWQNRALEGMLQALEPRRNLVEGASLPPRLKALLERREKGVQSKVESRLESRLALMSAKQGKAEAKATDGNTRQKE